MFNTHKIGSFQEGVDTLNNLSDKEKLETTILLLDTDSCEPSNIHLGLLDKNYNNFLLLRTSLIKSKKLNYERVLPVVARDSLSGWAHKDRHPEFEEPIPFKPCAPKDKPSIGFCGACGRTHRQRGIFLDEFEKQDKIQTDFIRRPCFFGSRLRGPKKHWHIEFKENLKNNIFAFCYRGAGNFSVRFYEALAAGRIPALIESDNELPFENMIDWKNKIIVAKSVDEVVKKMLKVWETRDITLMQKECGELYKEYFMEEAFIKNMHKV